MLYAGAKLASSNRLGPQDIVSFARVFHRLNINNPQIKGSRDNFCL